MGKCGIKDTSVQFFPNKQWQIFCFMGARCTSTKSDILLKHGKKYPANEHIGAFGCDSHMIYLEQ